MMKKRNIGEKILSGLKKIKAWQLAKKTLRQANIVLTGVMKTSRNFIKGRKDYVPFDLADYVDNPVAFLRIKAGIAQAELASCMSVTQAYIEELEAQDKVADEVMEKVSSVLRKQLKKSAT